MTITTNELVIIILALVLLALGGAVILAAVAYLGMKFYKAVVNLGSSVDSLSVKAKTIEDSFTRVPNSIDEFARFTKGHAAAALKNAAAVEKLSELIGAFSSQIFSTQATGTVKVPSDAEVSMQFEIEDLLRSGAATSREEAKHMASNMIGME